MPHFLLSEKIQYVQSPKMSGYLDLDDMTTYVSTRHIIIILIICMCACFGNDLRNDFADFMCERPRVFFFYPTCRLVLVKKNLRRICRRTRGDRVQEYCH